MIQQRHPYPITPRLMVIDTCFEYINIRDIKNRRFMFNPRTGILILSEDKYNKKGGIGFHADDFHESGAPGCYDDYLRGWIGCAGNYKNGIVHFASSIERETFDQGFDTLKIFSRMENISARTIVRGFYGVWEEKIGVLLPSSFN